MTITDSDLNVELGKLRLRSYRDGNYILMTIILEGSAFAKSIKRTMQRTLVGLNKTDAEYSVPVVPLAPGHLEKPGIIHVWPPVSPPSHLNGSSHPNY